MEDYEKKYKEALANARQEYNTTKNVERKQWLEELFHELKESEDEKIRKALVNLVEIVSICIEKTTKERLLAWLEKQKPVDKSGSIASTSEGAITYTTLTKEEAEGKVFNFLD